MKFTITRSSDWSGKKPPCDGVFLEGKDEYGNDRYVKEFKNLEDVFEFIKIHKRVVIFIGHEFREENTIEIYDDYRE